MELLRKVGRSVDTQTFRNASCECAFLNSNLISAPHFTDNRLRCGPRCNRPLFRTAIFIIVPVSKHRVSTYLCGIIIG